MIGGFQFDIIIFTNPSTRAGYETRSIFKQSLTDFNSELSFSYTSCWTKSEEPSLSYYLPIAGGRIIWLISSSRVLGLCEMQSISSRIWTCVAVSISYDDNHYTTGPSFQFDLITQLNEKTHYSEPLFQIILSHNFFFLNFEQTCYPFCK